jgi:hypothetical protein
MTATISLSNVVETVTIRILLGLLRHDSPAVRRRPLECCRCTAPSPRRCARRRVNLWPSLSGGEIVDLMKYGVVKGVSCIVAQHAAAEVVTTPKNTAGKIVTECAVAELGAGLFENEPMRSSPLPIPIIARH